MRVLAISGSLRAASHNTALLRAAAELAPDGVQVEFYDGLDLLPAYSEDREDEPTAEVTRFRDAIDDVDAVLFSTPEYNGTMPGHLKTAVDWASRPHRGSSLWGKPVAVIGASITDYGAIWAQDHLRKSLGLAGARVMDGDFPVGKAQERFDSDGELVDLELREQLEEIVTNLADHAGALAKAA